MTYEFEMGEDEEDEVFMLSDGAPEEDWVDVQRLQEVWNQFASLLSAIKSRPGEEEYMHPHEFQESARKWARNFKNVTFDDDVIPYIHCK